MFRPIHIVWNQSILGNRDIENFELEKQCSAQNGAKSVALSMPMMNTRFVCVYLLPLLKRAGVDHFVKGNCQLHCQRYLYWLRARASCRCHTTRGGWRNQTKGCAYWIQYSPLTDGKRGPSRRVIGVLKGGGWRVSTLLVILAHRMPPGPAVRVGFYPLRVHKVDGDSCNTI